MVIPIYPLKENEFQWNGEDGSCLGPGNVSWLVNFEALLPFMGKTGLKPVVTFNLLLQIPFGHRACYVQNSN